MNRKNATTESLAQRIGSEHRQTAAEPAQAPEGEEWAWMVDEDPAFYLSTSGSVENAGG